MDGHLWHHLLPCLLGTFWSPEILTSCQPSHSGYSQWNLCSNDPSSFKFHSLLYLHFKFQFFPSGIPPPANTSTRLGIIMNMWEQAIKRKPLPTRGNGKRRYKERKSSLALLIQELSPWTREIWTESFLIFQLRNGKLEAGGRCGGVHMGSCLTLYRRIPHLLIKHIFTLTFFSKIIQLEVGDAEIKHDWIEIYTRARLFTELAPILCLFTVFGLVNMKLIPYKGRVYFSTFETGMDYEFLFVLANKHGGSDSVLKHVLSFWLLTLRCWLSCVNIAGGPSRGGDIHT